MSSYDVYGNSCDIFNCSKVYSTADLTKTVEELSKNIQRLNIAVMALWLNSLSEKDKERALKIKKKPNISFKENGDLCVTWDGLTLDEIDVKDIIE